MSEHPATVDLEGLLDDTLDAERLRTLVPHLLSGCPPCARRLATLFAEGSRSEGGDLSAVELAAYDGPLERAFAAVALYGAAAPEKTERRNAALRALAVGGAAALDPERFGLSPTYDALLLLGTTARQDDPALAGSLFRLAASVGAVLGQEGFSPAQAADCCARAYGEYANALRIQDNLPAAESLMRDALGKAAKGTGDRALWYHLRDLEASLLTQQWRYAEAIERLEEVFQGYRELGDEHLAGRALLNLGTCVGFSRSPAEALRILAEAATRIDFAREPNLRIALLHNRLALLVEAGALEQAVLLLRAEQGLLLHERKGLDRVKLDWIEGRIHAGLGQAAEAERAFLQARAGFRALGAPSHGVTVNLDLALVYLGQGRTAEAGTLVAEALHTFAELKVPHAQAEAMLVLAQIVQQDRLSAALLQSIADFLRRAEHNPHLRYQSLG